MEKIGIDVHKVSSQLCIQCDYTQDLYCILDEPGTTNTAAHCVRIAETPALGERCVHRDASVVQIAPECGLHMYCDNETCYASSGLGESCGSSGQCDGDLVCDGGACEACGS
ncbi:MAG: hypothetical protein IPK60_00495 [Sandaracinaceae bacterium]|jgi:hypothetical protein|nr:hypothetical protein [Sandaracinaceae bacterium]